MSRDDKDWEERRDSKDRQKAVDAEKLMNSICNVKFVLTLSAITDTIYDKYGGIGKCGPESQLSSSWKIWHFYPRLQQDEEYVRKNESWKMRREILLMACISSWSKGTG